jgi:hypothetical protein
MAAILEVRLEDGSVAAIDTGFIGGGGGGSIQGSAGPNLPVVIDTGFSPGPNQAATVSIAWCVYDNTVGGQKVTGNTAIVSVRKSPVGTLTIAAGAAEVLAANAGDAALATEALTFSVSLNNTLVCTFTPPAAYPNATFVSAVVNPIVNVG